MNTRQFQDTAVGKTLTAATNSVLTFFIVTCLSLLFILMEISTEELKEIWTREEIRCLSVPISFITIVFVAISSFSFNISRSLPYWCGGFAGILLSVGVILYNAEAISILGNNEATRFVFHFAFVIAMLKVGQIIGNAIYDAKHDADERIELS